MSSDELCDIRDVIIFSAYWYKLVPCFRWAEFPIISYVIYGIIFYTLRSGIDWCPVFGGQIVQ